ncbi:MAG TPA: tail fiber domain-containing protein [Porticoccaceae bacterium]
MGKGAPEPPDPWETAAAQGQWNAFTAQQQQLLNMVDQVTPWGTLTYDQIGTTTLVGPDGKRYKIPRYLATQELSPEQQAIFERTQAAQQNLADIAQEQSEWLKGYLNEPFEFTNRDAELWAWDLAAPRILQQQQQNEQALRTRLLNMGLRPGTTAWEAEMTRQSQANNDQLNQLALTGRQMAFNEAIAQRNQPLNELIGLMSGTQIQNPNATYVNTPQTGVAGVDYTGLVNQKYQAELANYQAGMGGLFGLGAALIKAMPFSDERLKTDIRKVGETYGGTPVYTFRYKDDPTGTVYMGVMAQDVPEARVKDPSGYWRVDYSRVN